MRTTFAPLLLLTALACADPEDSGTDTGPPADAGASDQGVDASAADLGPRLDSDVDAGLADAEGTPDAAEPDAGPDDGAVGFPIRIAYSAAAETPLLVELYLTDTSTSRAKVNGALAGGSAGGGKEPPFAGLREFYWTADGQALLYVAQQDQFNRYEIYRASIGPARPGASSKLSLPAADGEAYFEGFSPTGRRVAFDQLPVGGNHSDTYVVSATAAPVHAAINQGFAAAPKWSPVDDQFVFFDIIQSQNDRDLWFADVRNPPFRTERVNPGANLGFNASAAWSADGQRLLYVADESALRLFELYLVDITAGVLGPRIRVHPALAATQDVETGEETIGFSPDGRYAGYAVSQVVNPPQAAEVFVVDVDASPFGAPVSVSGPLPLASDGLASLRFSADNAHLYYLADQDQPGTRELYRAGFAAGSSERLNDALPPNQAVTNFLELPAGPSVLYQAGDFRAEALYWVDLASGTPAPPVPLYANQATEWVSAYSVSPAGDYVVFSVQDTDTELWTLQRVDLSGPVPSAPQQLAGPGVENTWCWAEDGRLAFGADLEEAGTGELYLVSDLAAPAPVKISGPIQAGGRVYACAFPPR